MKQSRERSGKQAANALVARQPGTLLIRSLTLLLNGTLVMALQVPCSIIGEVHNPAKHRPAEMLSIICISYFRFDCSSAGLECH